MSPRSVLANANPSLLKWGRETAGMTVEQVADRFHKTATVIQSWESGDAHPTMRQLEKLAEAYKRPLVIFYLPEPPAEPPAPADFRTLPQDRPRSLSTEVRLALRRARRVQRVFTELAGELGTLSRPAFQRVNATADPERVAAALRRRLDVGLTIQRDWSDVFAAFRNWRDSAERLGILVLQAGMPVEEVRGFSLSDDPAPVVVVSTRDFVSARIFTLFHEVAHVIVNTGGICIPELGAPLQQNLDVEQFCNHFAGALLVPPEALDSVPVPDRAPDLDEAMRRAARSLKVSRYVVLRRLLIAGRVTYERFHATMERWNAEPRQPTRGGPSSPAEKVVSRYGTTFVSTVVEAHDRGSITASDLSDFLSVKVNHLREINSIIAARRRA